jgi:predicted deacylase
VNATRDSTANQLEGARWRLGLLMAVVALLGTVAAFGPDTVSASAAAAPPDVTLETSESVTPTAPPAPAWAPIGYSVRGRPINAIRFGSGSKHVLIVAGIHGTEYGYDVARKFVAYLLANPSAIPAGTQVDIIALANPDGRALRRRGNARGVDLNRNFPARNWRRINRRGRTAGRSPGSEPETQAIMRFMEAGHYTRVITLHSRGPIVDFDGPGGWALAKRFSRAARMPIFRLSTTGHYYGSMGNWVPQRYRIPIVTIELKDRALRYRLRMGLLSTLQ